MSETTPGPWRVWMTEAAQLTVNSDVDDHGLIAWIEGDSNATQPTAREVADADLISAAPEMYAALKAMLDPNECTRDIDMAIAAIRKAEGRES